MVVVLQTLPGLEQYSVKNYAEAFEAFPRALAESSGVKEREVISTLYAAHNAGEKTVGFDIEVITFGSLSTFREPPHIMQKFDTELHYYLDVNNS